MKRVKIETLIGIVLIAVLGFYGVRLVRSTLALSRLAPTARSSAGTNRRLVFQSEAGIDVWGKPVYPLPAAQAKRTIIFLLRGASIAADLDFWRNVESLLPKNAGLHLVGYCDGNNCADAVRRDAKPPGFPVIAYGEVIGSQALVNVDANGNSILMSEQWLQSKRVKWREPTRTPLSVVQEALR